MRPLQPFASYVDNSGALLVGRVRFYNLDGSPANVYQKDGNNYTSLGASVFTDSSGRTVPQVFLEDHDYQLFFDKYVGAGTMAEDDNEESWEEQGSAIDTYQTFGISLDADGIRAIANIDALRLTTGVFQNEVVAVMGYGTRGDCDPVYYRWDGNSTASDDGGSVIQRTTPGVGRWIMVGCPEYLDVRHFGAFPLQGKEASTTQRYAIQLAAAYAHDNGCGIYFPATELAVYYDISGLELYDVKANPNARVFCASTMQAGVYGMEDLHCTSGANLVGVIHLHDKTVRTSSGGDSTHVEFLPTEKLIIDSTLTTQTTYRRWSNIQVEILVDNAGVQLDGCEITSLGAIESAIRISNCELQTSWFNAEYNWGTGLQSLGNRIYLRNCSDATTYILLKNKQNEADYGDLGEQTIANVTLLDNCIAENAMFNSVTLAGSSELHNCSGTIAAMPTTATSNWIDCWIAFLDDIVVGNFQMARGNLQSEGSIHVVGTCNLDGVSVNPNVVVEGALLAENSSFIGTVICNSLQSAKCTYVHDITVYAQANLSVVFVGNTVTRTCTMHLQTADGVTGVRAVGCVWQGNIVLPRQEPSSFWISVDGSFDNDDSQHDYVYSDNLGAEPGVGRKTATLGAYQWEEWYSVGDVNLMAWRTAADRDSSSVGTAWELQLNVTSGLIVPNTFAIGGTNCSKTSTIRVRIHSSAGGSFYYEFPANVNMKSGQVTSNAKQSLTPIAMMGDNKTRVTNPIGALWSWSNAYVMPNPEPPADSSVTLVAFLDKPWQ